MKDPFLLLHELYDRAGVPDAARAEVAYRIAAAKFCAYVEQVEKLIGEPVEISLARVQEILDQDPFCTDPREIVMIIEEPACPGEQSDVYSLRLARVEEVRAANRRYALHRMGARRN